MGNRALACIIKLETDDLGVRRPMSQQEQLAVTSTVKRGMDWITAALHSVAQTWQMPFNDSRWELSHNEAGNQYALIVEGQRKKKMIKRFTSWELENCLSDTELQGDLHMRLLKILNSVAPSAEIFKGKIEL